MTLTVDDIYTKEELKKKLFPKWSKVDAFIFENGVLVGIVYKPDLNPLTDNTFYVYGMPDGDYHKIFKTNPVSSEVIPVFKSLEDKTAIFIGHFKGNPSKTNSTSTLSDGRILVGKIEVR